MAATPPPPNRLSEPLPLRTTLRLLLPLASIVALLLLVFGGAAGGLRWLLLTEGGAQWLLPRLHGVEITGARGALLGDSWHAERILVRWGTNGQQALIEGLQAEGMQWHWRPSKQSWVGLDVKSLSVRSITVDTGPPSKTPLTLPASIASPLQLAVAQASVEELLINKLEPINGINAQGLALTPTAGAEHHIDAIAARAYGLAIAGGLRINTTAPLALAAHAALRPAQEGDNPRWAAVLNVAGNVAQMALTGKLRGMPLPGHAAPAVDLATTLRPFEPWVLGELNLQTQSLDLAALWPQAPATSLSGQAEIKGGEKAAPLLATVSLINAEPGRWNERRLPLKSLTLQAEGSLQQRDRIDFRRIEMALADATRGAGRLTGSAVWQGHALTLNTTLADVAPQRLDGRAAAMTLSGPVLATLRGLPTPDFTARPATPTPPLHVDWKLDLQGKLDAAPQAVRLLLEGQADAQHVELKRAHAQSGKASADFNAMLARAAGGEWQVETVGKLLDFDPLPWWPGDAGGAWRKGPHRLSGDWKFDVRLPANAAQLAPVALAQRLAGNGSLTVRDSLLAGVPLAADIALGYTQAAAPAAGSLRVDLRLGGNQFIVEGRGDPMGSGESDRWRAELKAETLATLAPLARLAPALAEWAPRQGSANATLAADGRWPALRTEGTARLAQLQLGTFWLTRGTAAWKMGMGVGKDNAGDQPLSMQLELTGLQLGKQKADHLRADLRGTLADHHIDISGALPVMPPPIAEQMLGIQAQAGTQAQMQAQGAWLPAAGVGNNGGGRWKAHVERLLVGPWDGKSTGTSTSTNTKTGASTASPPAAGWAEAHDLRAELQFNAAGQLASVQADAGRMRFADTATLRWDEVRIGLLGALPQIQLRADIEPFALAPLLARAQPGTGWQGDLKLAARVDVRAAEKLDAEVVFERTEGDLMVASGEGARPLGLSELRLALSAHDGVWNFTQAFKGRSLGDISGQVKVQTTPERRWPAADAPISGVVEARAADIGIWSAWVPAGWRLTGEVSGKANVSGRFGAPQYTGDISGTGLGVRNLLQGVNISDGQIALRLSGDTAQIDRFTFKGGEGSLSITGGATLGAAPQARLQLKAERFKLLGRVDRQLVASGNAELIFAAEKTQLDGKFKIDEGLFDISRSDAPSLDDDVTVKRPGMVDEAPADPGAPKPKRNFVLGLDIDLGDKLRLRGRGIDTGLRGQVRATTPSGRLAINGTINAVDGTYAAYGQRLEIERGNVFFSGPMDNPRLDILALRPNIDTRVGVQIIGNLLTLRVRLFSEPALSDTDTLAWLVLGRAPDGLGRNDTALLQRAAVALFAGEGEAPTDALLKALGIDDVSLRQGDGDVRETVISIGKQLSRRWYLGYERGVNATTGTWQLIYRIAQRFTLRAQSGLDNSLDVIWTWRFQETPADASTRKITLQPK